MEPDTAEDALPAVEPSAAAVDAVAGPTADAEVPVRETPTAGEWSAEPDSAPLATTAESAPTTAPTAPATTYSSTPAPKRRRNADPSGENPDDIIKVTFDVRRGDRDAFNAAVAAAVLFEGHKNAGAFIAYIYNSARERLENDYNHGQPFERREKPLPRGGSFRRQGDA